MRKFTVIVALAGIFIGGFVTGRFAVGPSEFTTDASTARVARAVEELKKLDRENSRLRAALSEQRTEPVAAAKPALPKTDALSAVDRLHVLQDLQQKNLLNANIPILDRAGKITPAFAGLFNLTPVEQENLQRAIENQRTKLAELEKANGQISRDAQGNIVLSVRAFPAEGGKVYDDLMQSFAGILGADRNEAFRALAAEQVDRALGRFGAAERTYVFGYNNEREGQPYALEDKVIQRSEKGGVSSQTNRTRFKSFDELSKYIGPVVAILPPDFPKAP